MRHPIVSIAGLFLLAACGGKTATPAPPPTNEVAAAPAETGGDTYGGWDEGGWGGDTYGGGTYGGVEGGYVGEAYVPPPPQPPNLVGQWKGPCAADGKVHRQTVHVYTADRWDVRTGEFSDAACTKRLSEQHRGGTYAFGAESPAVETAWDVTFTVDVREITADDKKRAKAIGKACGVKLAARGTADVLAKGCPKLGIAACTTEYDVVALEGDKLRLGQRTAEADGCAADKRATALDTATDLSFTWDPVGIAECDALLAMASRYIRCAAMPGADGSFEQFRMMADQLRQYSAAGSDPAVVQATSDACKQATAALEPSLQQAGC